MTPHAMTRAATSFAIVILGLCVTDAIMAQETNPAHTHIRHVMDEFRGTPDGQGLLPTAIAEARVVIQHAALAARDLANLEAMKMHSRHVLHAIDPTTSERGPGLGYGLEKAAQGAVTHIELAARSEGASQNVTTHANHIATSIRNTIQRVGRLTELANQIQAANSADEAAPLVTELNSVAAHLIDGVDANEDGRIGWQEGEGGLQHAEQHVNLLKQAEGIMR